MDRIKAKLRRRQRRKRHVRKKTYGTLDQPRLTVTRSLQHICCQAIDDTRGLTLVSASTKSKSMREQLGGTTGTCQGAAAVGKLLAQRAKEAGIRRFCFDRNGYAYHGRVAKLCEALRKEGIEV